jgi:hypothetical protein
VTTPAPGVTVITATGDDYTVPSGQSWIPSLGPAGDQFVLVFDGQFEIEDDGTNKATGKLVGSFNDVEAIYPTASVTKTP